MGGPWPPPIHHPFTHVFTQHTRMEPRPSPGPVLWAEERCRAANHLSGPAHSQSPRGFQLRRGRGAGLGAHRASPLQRASVLTFCSPALSRGVCHEEAGCLHLPGAMAWGTREVGDAASSWSDGKTIPHSRGALHGQGGDPALGFAERPAVEEPLVWWAACTYKDGYIQRHAAPYKQAVGWLIPRGRQGGGLALGEVL